MIHAKLTGKSGAPLDIVVDSPWTQPGDIVVRTQNEADRTLIKNWLRYIAAGIGILIADDARARPCDLYVALHGPEMESWKPKIVRADDEEPHA